MNTGRQSVLPSIPLHLVVGADLGLVGWARRGDVLVLYTDGLVEAERPDGETYGAGRLERRMRSLVACGAGATAIVRSLQEDVLRFVGRPRLSDDLTLLALHIEGAAPVEDGGSPDPWSPG